MSIYHYIIKGEPMAVNQTYEGSIWSEHKAHRLNIEMQLRNHHEGKPLLSGPLKVSFYFYIGISEKAKGKKKPGDYHNSAPSIANLVKFIEDIGKGIVFKSNYEITHIERVEKIYDLNPRTEIYIEEL